MYGGNNHARVNRRSPSAWAICDFCGSQWNRTDLSPDRQYMGSEVRPTGFLVCPICLDKPQPQQKAIRLPPDPLPVENPRVDNFSDGNFGFTQYQLEVVSQQAGGAGIGMFIIGVSAIGVGFGATSGSQTYPTSPLDALASLAVISGIPTPPALNDYSTTIAGSNVTQALVPANPTRSWIAIYSPGTLFAISEGQAKYGSLSNMITGPGECWFWATAQGAGTPYQGAMTVVSLQQGAPVWAWDA